MSLEWPWPIYRVFSRWALYSFLSSISLQIGHTYSGKYIPAKRLLGVPCILPVLTSTIDYICPFQGQTPEGFVGFIKLTCYLLRDYRGAIIQTFGVTRRGPF